jgi:hypothetical protein
MDYTFSMSELNARVERVIEEITGNETLLQMLDTDAASEMLNWGIATAKSIVSRTMTLMIHGRAGHPATPEAIRQSMRSIGVGAGKYVDQDSRIQLQDKLKLPHHFGEEKRLPSPK